MESKQSRTGHPYVEYENHPLWPVIDSAIGDLVTNHDLIEHTSRNYIVGYLCKVISEVR